MTNTLYTDFQLHRKQHQKKFSILIDPDNCNLKELEKTVKQANDAKVDYFFVGGSLVLDDNMDATLGLIKANSSIPIILFPGSAYQINPMADAIFFLSLISGRNPELLIGQHVTAAPMLRASGLEILPTGYILIDGGAPTTASYISNTTPIPANKNNIAVCTAMAGEMLGLKLLYVDAGSGAKTPITESMISDIRQNTTIPMIIGGGIRTPEKAYLNCKAGADVIVVGDAIEKSQVSIQEMADAIHSVVSVS